MQKEAIVIAGANGAGKTTFAREFLIENSDYEFLNADEIAKSINPQDPAKSGITSGREFFATLHDLVENGRSFIIESTLSGRYLEKHIALWKQRGYEIKIVFLVVESIDVLLERIAERVKKGGHYVPDADVRRRFLRGKNNFSGIYKTLADKWFLYYNTESGYHLIATGDKTETLIIDESLYESF